MKMVAVCSVFLAALCYTLSTVTAQEAPAGSLISAPRCGPVCAIFCEFGNVHDSSGCPTCVCNRSGAPMLNNPNTPGGLDQKPVRAVNYSPTSPFPPPPTTECPPGSTPIVPRQGCSGFTLVGQNQRCPGRRSFCVPDPADGPGVCCQRRYTPGGYCRPVNRRIRCFRHWDQCNTAADCRWGRRCCPGPCGRQCQRPGWSRYRGGRRSD